MIVRLRAIRSRHFLPWAQRLLFCAGFLILSICALVYLRAYLFQIHESRKFESAQTSPLPELQERASGAVEGSPIGLLEIPRLGVSVIVVEGVTEDSLMLAAGHIPGTAMPEQRGNIGIAAHRDTYFRALRHIRKNDVIRLSTSQSIFEYAVDSTQIVSPTKTEVLASSSEAVLTLVTCYPFYYVGPAPKRFIVRARKIGPLVSGRL